MAKKAAGILFLMCMLLLGLGAMLPMVSAQWGGWGGFGGIDLERGSNQVIQGIKDFTTPFFEVIIGDYSTNEFFFAKCLLLLLLFVIINVIIKKLPIFEDPNKKGIAAIIALVISILAIRFISENQLVLGILLPYGTLGVALTTILPFMIFFYFVYATGMGGLGRRLCWIFYGLVFVSLWVSRASEISSVQNWIYIWTLVAMVIAFFADRKIMSYFHAYGLNRYFVRSNRRNIASLKAEYATLNAVPGAAADRDIQARLREIAIELRTYHPGWHP